MPTKNPKMCATCAPRVGIAVPVPRLLQRRIALSRVVREDGRPWAPRALPCSASKDASSSRLARATAAAMSRAAVASLRPVAARGESLARRGIGCCGGDPDCIICGIICNATREARGIVVLEDTCVYSRIARGDDECPVRGEHGSMFCSCREGTPELVAGMETLRCPLAAAFERFRKGPAVCDSTASK